MHSLLFVEACLSQCTQPLSLLLLANQHCIVYFLSQGHIKIAELKCDLGNPLSPFTVAVPLQFLFLTFILQTIVLRRFLNRITNWVLAAELFSSFLLLSYQVAFFLSKLWCFLTFWAIYILHCRLFLHLCLLLALIHSITLSKFTLILILMLIWLWKKKVFRKTFCSCRRRNSSGSGVGFSRLNVWLSFVFISLDGSGGSRLARSGKE